MTKGKSPGKAWKQTREYKALRKDMLDDLEVRGLIGRQYIDKAEEYMNLWCWLKMLGADIEERGVFTEYQNGANQKGITDNKSLTIATRVSAQMLQIWSALGFREQAMKSQPESAGDEDEL